MFGLSFWEIAIIMLIALVVLGPSKLPEIARNLGKGLREFRKATEEFKDTVSTEMNRPDPPKYPPYLPPQPEAPAQILPPQASTPASMPPVAAATNPPTSSTPAAAPVPSSPETK